MYISIIRCNHYVRVP